MKFAEAEKSAGPERPPGLVSRGLRPEGGYPFSVNELDDVTLARRYLSARKGASHELMKRGRGERRPSERSRRKNHRRAKKNRRSGIQCHPEVRRGHALPPPCGGVPGRGGRQSRQRLLPPPSRGRAGERGSGSRDHSFPASRPAGRGRPGLSTGPPFPKPQAPPPRWVPAAPVAAHGASKPQTHGQ